jgi:eukaryotic-like serine/threonine-protein kinase
MALSPGTHLGAYEIVGIIGSGGMGEVYRARDTRLGRDVAIKVLPALLATDPDALARFEREMTTLAAVSHPHIVAIHDVGREGATAYAVTELLDGEALAEIAARGPVPIRKALEYGVQIARALAAAHDRGIVHRDLKPGNVFVTGDGQIKVLDFGLARNTAAAAAGGATMTGTTPGMVMGTVGYMAPEQARGLAVDHRADIFAFGCVMYELVSGRRAFQRDSVADTLSAILKEDPPPLSGANVAAPPALERVIQRCLEKNPAERFQSARDLAFALDGLSSASGGGTAITGTLPAQARRRWPRVAAAIAALGAMFLLGRALAPTAAGDAITIKRLTFERGLIRTARFAPDAETIVYGAAWNGAPLKVFLGRTDTGESKRLDLPDGDVHAVSASGEMALSLGRHYPTSWTPDGTLGRGRLFSSSVREVLEHVREADFLPNDALAIVRRIDGRDRLEVPQGTVVFETPGYISHIRVSPDGQRVGFLEHPLYGDNRGHVALYENGKARRLTVEYGGLEGLAWSRDGREIWFSGGNASLWKLSAVDAGASTPREGRTVWFVPGNLFVHDIDARGRVLLAAVEPSGQLRGAMAGDQRDRDLALGRWTLPSFVARDGRTLLATTFGGSDPNYTVQVSPMDGGVPVQIGSGRGQEMSPDGKWALSIIPSAPLRVMLLPTGAGESRRIDVGDLVPNVAAFVPGGLTVAVVGTRSGSPAAAIVDVKAGTRIDLALPELNGRAWSRRYLPTHASPDGSLLAIGADDGKVLAWKLPGSTVTPSAASSPQAGGGPARELASLATNEVFAGWSADPSRLYIVAWTGPKARVEALDVSTGRRTFVRDITVEDPAGMLMVMPDLFLSADARSYAYGYTRMLSTLYVVTGLR